MKTLSEFKVRCIHSLTSAFSDREKEQLFFYLLEHFAGVSKINYLLSSLEELSSDSEQKIVAAIDLLNAGQPIQYISGVAYFRDLALEVNSSVLIPRPETEELVELVLTACTNGMKVLDIGTGSGCIALSLKKEMRGLEVTALDVSSEALELAKKNGLNHSLEIQFIQMSMEKSFKHLKGFDVIISNPPYIGLDEKNNLEKNVLEHEPHLALFSINNDPLHFYREIGKRCQEVLLPGGYLFLELHESYSEQTKTVIKDFGLVNVEILTDMQGKERFLKAQKTAN